jgi:hypothetical protein
MFRKPDNLETDIEDLFPEGLYIDAFNKTYANELKGATLTIAELGKHPRIVERINQWLKGKGINLLKNGGFNHYRVAQSLVPMLTAAALTAADIERFETLFSRVNSCLS